MTARHDYPYVELGPQREQWSDMCEEIDQLRESYGALVTESAAEHQRMVTLLKLRGSSPKGCERCQGVGVVEERVKCGVTKVVPCPECDTQSGILFYVPTEVQP